MKTLIHLIENQKANLEYEVLESMKERRALFAYEFKTADAIEKFDLDNDKKCDAIAILNKALRDLNAI